MNLFEKIEYLFFTVLFKYIYQIYIYIYWPTPLYNVPCLNISKLKRNN